ncbi:hypothetical protein ABPG74_018348 [Tetrahymena malaccensis]
MNQLKKKCINEEQQRLIKIFWPYLVIISVGFSTSLVFQLYFYQQNVENQLKEYILEKYQNYLDVMTYSEKFILTLSFQATSQINQQMGLLKRDIMTNISYESIVSWDDQTPERYSLNQSLPNILLLSDFRLEDYCQIKEKCGQDQQCLNSFDNYILQYDQNRSFVQYQKTQWNTWSYQNQNQWQNLELEQKQFIIKSSLQMLFASSYVENQHYNYVQANAIYGARDKDGLLVGQYISSKILSNKFINNTFYGGPFQCLKVNGRYPEFKYSDIDQFGGFQYMDQAGNICGNEQKPCPCIYFNFKRMYPLDWRCRPWYQSANNTYYISYSQPYTDILLGLVSITCTFKVVIPTQNINSIEDELNFQSDAILAMDINLGELQVRFMKNNDTQTQYSYLVSTNTDKNIINFSPFVIAHPLMNKFQEQSIYDVEFQESDLTELEEFKNQTKFLIELQTNDNGCGLMYKNNDSQTLVIKKNNTEYITMFSKIQICFGNLYEQKTTAIAYYAIAISFSKRDQDIKAVEQTMNQMLQITVQLIVGVFVAILLLFYFLLKNFLFINFENPISILSNFVNKADSFSIYDFNKKIQEGQLKTQYELKNFIYAINQVVLNVMQRIQKKLENNDSNYTEIIQAYQDQLKVFDVFSHQYGIGMCLNNMAIMYLLLKNYKEALIHMNKSEKISCSSFQKFIQPMIKTKGTDQLKIISYHCEQVYSAVRKHDLNVFFSKDNIYSTINRYDTEKCDVSIFFLRFRQPLIFSRNRTQLLLINKNQLEQNLYFLGFQTIYLNIEKNQLVSWDDNNHDRYSQNGGKPYFLITNDDVLDDYCNLKSLCGSDQNCLSTYDDYINQYNPFRNYVQYEKSQYSSFSSSNYYLWNNLTIDQKEYLIKMNLIKVFAHSFVFTTEGDYIQSTSVYIAEEEYGFLVDYFLMRKLIATSALNSTFYGGPFTCNKINGEYPKYAFTSADQFDGFQYKDKDLNVCGNSNNPCSCSYFNQKRLFPVEWRCRPWYIDANQTFSVTYTVPYVDITQGLVASTCIYKIVLPKPGRDLNSISDDQNYQADAVSAFDIDLANLQQRFMQNSTIEYSYLVTSAITNEEQPNDKYVIAHPQMNRFVQQTILEVEFQYSTNKQSEEDYYLEQTEFMKQPIEYENKCQFQFLNSSNLRTIYKNYTGYITLFVPIKVCIGNLFEQKQYIIAYYAKAFSLEQLQNDVNQILESTQLLIKICEILFIILFLLLMFVKCILLRYFLQVNFEIPIKILTEFINNASSQDVYKFNQLLEKKQLCTQLELKNLILAICEVVLKIHKKVYEQINSGNQDYDIHKVQEKLKDSLQTFKIFSHNIGIGMSFNNLAVLCFQQQIYQKALDYMSKSVKTADKVFQEMINQFQQLDQLNLKKNISNQTNFENMNSQYFLFGNSEQNSANFNKSSIQSFNSSVNKSFLKQNKTFQNQLPVQKIYFSRRFQQKIENDISHNQQDVYMNMNQKNLNDCLNTQSTDLIYEAFEIIEVIEKYEESQKNRKAQAKQEIIDIGINL